MISSKELVYRALAFEPVPRVPYKIDFTVPAKEKLLASPQGRELYENLDDDIVGTPIIKIEYGVRDEKGFYKDEFGVVWNRSIDPDIGVPAAVITPETIDDYTWPDPLDEQRFVTLEQNLKQYPDKFQAILFDFSLFERSWTMRGLEKMLMDFIENPDFVGQLLDKIVEFNIAIMEAAFERYPEIDGVYFGDDFGTQEGVMMGARIWRSLLKPRLIRQYRFARKAGKKVFIHSCGKVQELFDDLIEMGLQCFNPFQPEVMDVYKLLDQYHGTLAFFGGISTQKLLPYGSTDDVTAEITKLLTAGRKGGYIIAPAHATPGDAKLENMCTMLEMIQNQT